MRKIVTKLDVANYTKTVDKLFNTMTFGYATSNREVVRNVCHAHLNKRGNSEAFANFVGIPGVSVLRPGSYDRVEFDAGEKDVVRYYDWLANRSPFSYMVSDPYLVPVVNGYSDTGTKILVVDVRPIVRGVPVNSEYAAFAANCLTRYPWEWGSIVKNMYKFHDLTGLPETFCFLVAHFYKGGYFDDPTYVTSHHLACHFNMRTKAYGYFNAAINDLKYTGDPDKKDNEFYRGITNWGLDFNPTSRWLDLSGCLEVAESKARSFQVVTVDKTDSRRVTKVNPWGSSIFTARAKGIPKPGNLKDILNELYNEIKGSL